MILGNGEWGTVVGEWGTGNIMFTKKEGGMALDYRELDVWKMSMELCEQVYGLVRHFPTDERYALGDQLRRAVVSIPSIEYRRG